jgi:tetratricopeptide (TPR) repeat protein
LKTWFQNIAFKFNMLYPCLKALMRRGAVRLETGLEGAEAAALEDLKAAEKIEPENKELQRLKAKAQRTYTDKYERKTMKRMTITEEGEEESAGGDAPPTPSAAKSGKFTFDEKKKKTPKSAPASATSPLGFNKFGPPPPLRTGPVDQVAEGEEAKNLGNEHFKKHRFAEAAAAYTEALVSMPGMASAYCNRSGAHLNLGDHEGAISDASSALALDPGYAKAFHRRAAAYRAMGDLDSAGKDYDAAIAAVGRRTLCILLPTPPPPLIGWNMCRPMRRLNDVCVGQSEGCLPQLASLHRGAGQRGFKGGEEGDVRRGPEGEPQGGAV